MSGGLRVCSWEDVSFSDAERLLELSADTESLQSHLTELLAGKLAGKGDKQSAIELDLFTYAVLFCKKNSFSQEQLSAFFSILKSIHAMCVSTPYDNLQETSDYFRDLLLRHCVQRPPFSTSLFSVQQAKAITDYVLSTYFRHFKMYKFAFTERVQLSLSFQYSGEQDGDRDDEREVADVQADPQEEEEVQGEEKAEQEIEKEEREEEVEEVGAEQQRVRDIVTSALTTHLNKLKVSVEQQMTEREKRISEKIAQLETSSENKSKKK